MEPGVQINTILEAAYSDVASRVELAKFIDNQVPYNEADMNHFLTPNMEAGKKELMRAWQFGFDVSMKGNPGNTELTKQRNLVERMLVFGFESDPDAYPPGERLIVVKPQRAFYKEDQEYPEVTVGLVGAQGAHFEKGWRRVNALVWIWHTFFHNPEPLDLAKKGMGDKFFALSRLCAMVSPHFEKPLDSIDAARLSTMK